MSDLRQRVVTTQPSKILSAIGGVANEVVRQGANAWITPEPTTTRDTSQDDKNNFLSVCCKILCYGGGVVVVGSVCLYLADKAKKKRDERVTLPRENIDLEQSERLVGRNRSNSFD